MLPCRRDLTGRVLFVLGQVRRSLGRELNITCFIEKRIILSVALCDLESRSIILYCSDLYRLTIRNDAARKRKNDEPGV